MLTTKSWRVGEENKQIALPKEKKKPGTNNSNGKKKTHSEETIVRNDGGKGQMPTIELKIKKKLGRN